MTLVLVIEHLIGLGSKLGISQDKDSNRSSTLLLVTCALLFTLIIFNFVAFFYVVSPCVVSVVCVYDLIMY